MAKSQGQIFSRDSIRRIGDAVRKVEGATTKTDDQPSGVSHYQFKGPLHLQCGAARGYGVYTVTLLTPSEAETIDPDDDATLAMVGVAHTPAAGITVIGINTLEIGKETNAVDNGSIWPCSIIRRPTPSSPVLVLSFQGFGFFECT